MKNPESHEAAHNFQYTDATDKRADTEKEVLLSINHAIARVKDRISLYQVINQEFRKLFYFSHSITLQLSADETFLTAFLLDNNSKSTSYPGYEQIVAGNFPVDDGIMSLILQETDPVIIDIQKEAETLTAPDYIKMNYDTGSKEFLAVVLRRATSQPLGILTFFSDKNNSFPIEVVRLVHGVSFHISTAMENILFHEEIRQRDNENEILFEFSNKIVAVKEKEDLLNVLRFTLKKYIPYDDCNVLTYSKVTQSYRIYLYDVLEKRLADPVFQAMNNADYPDLNYGRPYHFPELVDVETLVRYGVDWGEKIYSMGVRQVILVKLVYGSDTLGQVVLMSDTERFFTQDHLSLLHKISFQLANALANLLVAGEVQARENEKSVLLSLSKHMALTRNKCDLQAVMKSELRKLFYFSGSEIVLFSENGKRLTKFVSENDSKEENLKPGSYPCDNISASLVNHDSPVLFDLDSLEESGRLPGNLSGKLRQGVKEMVCVGLRNEKNVFGALSFYSDRKPNFSANHIEIIHGVANQISFAVANIIANENIELKERNTQILLSLSAAIDKVRDRNDLVDIIRNKLNDLISFTDIAITLYNPLNKTYSVFAHNVQQKREFHPEFDSIVAMEYPLNDGIHDVALAASGPVIIDMEDAMKNPNKHQGTQFIYESGIKKMLLTKLTNNDELLGFINILSENENSFSDINFNIFKGITDQLSNAISNILSVEEIKRRDRENELLLSVSHAIASIRDKRDFVQMIQRELKSYLLFSDIAISIFDLETGTYRVFLECCEKTILHPDFNEIAFDEYPIVDGLHNHILDSDAPVSFYIEEIRDPEMIHIEFLYQAGIKRVVGMRMEQNNQIIGAIVFLSENDWPFSQQQKNFIQRLSYHMATAVSNIRANEKIEQHLTEIKKYKEQLEEEKLYLQEEAGTGYSYSDIIGEGDAMQKVFQLLSQVSFTNSTVLLLGETGTGKELIARAIHNSSSRKDKLMVKVNCAALPANLIESELFGHERGSFTGATERRLGKFELANKGTLFLDEIGEMPLDLQVKLLRALQEKEIERVGGNTTIRVDVRVIAATNRDLQKEVAEGRFRHDLFYRLNVFPITLPPLRKHKEDIPSLAVHFLNKYAKNNGRKISHLSSKVMKELLAYNWPGNVRELEHLMERSVLMTTGDTIREMYLPKIKSGENKILDEINLKTHEQNERDHIIEVLNNCKGKIYGAGGAAEILNLKVGTLNSKIKKLGIMKEQIVFVSSGSK